MWNFSVLFLIKCLNNLALFIMKSEFLLTVSLFIALLIIMALIAFFLYYRYRTKLKLEEDKRKLNEKDQEINVLLWQDENRVDELKVKNDIIKQNKELIINQKEKLARQSDELNAVTNYSEAFINGLLPQKADWKNIQADIFVLFRPRHSIGSDFYWFYERNNQIVIIGGDCNGHTMQAALSALVSLDLLKEIVFQTKLLNPAKIIQLFQKRLNRLFDEYHDNASFQFSVKSAVCVTDLTHNRISYCGASMPLYVLRRQKNNSVELLSIKADNQMLGNSLPDDYQFERHELDLKENDTLYIFSDGYSDQIGGTEERKFLQRRFKQLLVDINHTSINEQEAMLNKTIEMWKGDAAQTDDIMVIGLKPHYQKIEKHETGKYNWSMQTILVVEDDEAPFLIIEDVLDRTEVNLVWVKDGEEAIKLCNKTGRDYFIDLIIMDLYLPRINGFEAIKRIKSVNRDIPIVVLTSHSRPQDKKAAFDAGCDDYITKPVLEKELLEAVKRNI